MDIEARLKLTADSANTFPTGALTITVAEDTVILRIPEPDRTVAVSKTDFARLARFVEGR